MDRKKIAVACGACLAGILLVFLLAGRLESGQKKTITRQTESSVIGTESDELKTDQPDQPDQTNQDRASVGQAAAANGANRQLSPGQTGSAPAAVDNAQADAQKETPAAVTDTPKSSKTSTDKSSSGKTKSSKSKTSKSKSSKSKTSKSAKSSKSKSSDSEDIRIVGGNNKTNQGSGPLFEGEEKVILPSESLDPEQIDPKKDPQDDTQSQPQQDQTDNKTEDEAGDSGKDSQPSDETSQQPENPDHHSDDREGIQLPVLLF